MKIGFLGPKSSFTHAAAKKAFPTDDLLDYPSITSCIKGVESGEVDVSVVPIENSIEGSVNTTLDYLFHQAMIPVQAEIVLPIYQQLMIAPENKENWQEITKIMSHPQALGQSHDFLQRHFPRVELEATSSTAYAAKYVAKHPEQKIAAIAPKLSAQMYHLEIVGQDIQDVTSNCTCFWVLGPNPTKLTLQAKQKKMTIALTMPNNTPGALHKALSVFSWREIDLSKIESRPLKTVLGEYFFLIDINDEKPIKLIENALEELAFMGAKVKILGRYSVYPSDGI